MIDDKNLPKFTDEQLDEMEKAFDFSTGEFRLEELSEGLRLLVVGYIEYAKEVIIARALPALDGLKPVHRRILHTLMSSKVKGLQKCSRIAGNVLAFHPHGDTAVYEAMTRMVDLNETFRIPLIKGQGAFSWVYSSEKPADKRYTEAMLHENALMLYNTALDGVKYVPNFDGSETEPELYSTVMPVILCNNSQGIAVGFSCNIPPFNPIDVLDLTIERIERGKCESTIMPDFVTGCCYVKNDKELMKLMRTGKGKMKLRARAEIDSKYISFKEIPFNTTVQKLKKEIEKLDNPDIKLVSDYCDIDGLELSIECTSKSKVQDVLYFLYKNTHLQTTVSANMTIIKDEEPVSLGVWGIIDEWLAVRTEQLRKHYQVALDATQKKGIQAKAVIDLVAKPEIRDKMIDLTVHDSDASAIKYIQEQMGYDYELAKFVVGRNNSALRDGGKYAREYDALQSEISVIQGYLDDLHGYIKRELLSLKASFAGKYPRLTEVTTTDYDFSSSNDVIKDESDCIYTLKDGFLKKERNYGYSSPEEGAITIYASASDILMGIDDNGRLLRVYCEHIPYTDKGLGVYLPKYFSLEDKNITIKALWRFDGERKMLLYTDGFVSFLDTSEWLDTQRQTKVIERGVNYNSDKLFYVGGMVSNIFVSDSNGYVAWVPTSTIGVKSRTGRTRVFHPSKGAVIDSYALLSDTDLYSFLAEPTKYFGNKLLAVDDISEFKAMDMILDIA